MTSIVARAIELDPEDRIGFLDKECAEDGPLRDEVEDLLARHGDVPSVLLTGAAAARSFEALDGDPETVGPYAIVERIGEGGMGIVYRARQTSPLDRVVALKLIRRGFETDQVLRRFESERQTLARMSHPNVARVYDAGVASDGRPYFAMELIEGLSITEHSDRHGLSIEARLHLLMAACDGVQHAHRRGVLHRDLKPSNILVALEDAVPVPKIIDFGIAKALDRTGEDRRFLTEVETLVGTPEYMSPEQADPRAGSVDTRSDVYSLGAVLYELLSGSVAIDPDSVRRASAEETRRRVREVEPPRPSDRLRGLGESAREVAARRASNPASLEKRLRGELDWIVTKAMEKDPARRYGAPADLAEDLRRHLRHEAVQAGPPGAAYRARKFVRRHHVALSVVLTAGIVAIAFALTVGAQARSLAKERDRASREAAIAAAVASFLTDVFELGPGVPPRVDDGSPAEILGNRLAEVGGATGVAPAVAARLDLALGDAYRRLGRLGQAEREIRKACARLDEAPKANEPLILDCRRALAKVFEARGDFPEAEAVYREVVSRSARSLGERHADTLRAKSDLAFLLKAWSRNDEAEALFDDAIEGFRQVLGRDHPETLMAEGYRVGVVLEQRRYAELEQPLRHLRDRMLAVLGPRHGESRAAVYNLALVELNLGRRDEGLRLLSEAIAAGFTNGDSLTRDHHLRPLYGTAELAELDALQDMNNAGKWGSVVASAWRDEEQGHFASAEARLLAVVEAAERTGLPDHPAVAAAEYGLIRSKLRARSFNDAERYAVRRIEGLRLGQGGESDGIAAMLEARAACRAGLGDVPGALEFLNEASRIAGRRAPLPPPGETYRTAVRSALEGDLEGALAALALVPGEDYACVEVVATNPAFDALRTSPGYLAVVTALRTLGRACPDER